MQYKGILIPTKKKWTKCWKIRLKQITLQDANIHYMKSLLEVSGIGPVM